MSDISVIGSTVLATLGSCTIGGYFAFPRFKRRLTKELREIEAKLERTRRELKNEQEANDLLRSQVSEQPERRQVYNLITMGISGSGKTALTLKWANPLSRLDQLKPTKFLSYDRTVSRQRLPTGTALEHVFAIRDWGGEHIVDAQNELVLMNTIHGMLLAVDLAEPPPPDKPRERMPLSQARIQRQIDEFDVHALRYFFGERVTSYCKTFVLFINKSDVISGTPDEVDAEARRLYQPLIDNLTRYHQHGVEVAVLVGSALSGHNVHLLFPHFIEKILPRDAYDRQLLAQIQGDVPPQAAAGADDAAPRPGAPQDLRY